MCALTCNNVGKWNPLPQYQFLILQSPLILLITKNLWISYVDLSLHGILLWKSQRFSTQEIASHLSWMQPPPTLSVSAKGKNISASTIVEHLEMFLCIFCEMLICIYWELKRVSWSFQVVALLEFSSMLALISDIAHYIYLVLKVAFFPSIF